MEFKYLIVEREVAIAKVTINKPKSLNALNSELLTELNKCMYGLSVDESVDVVVITGEG